MYLPLRSEVPSLFATLRKQPTSASYDRGGSDRGFGISK